MCRPSPPSLPDCMRHANPTAAELPHAMNWGCCYRCRCWQTHVGFLPKNFSTSIVTSSRVPSWQTLMKASSLPSARYALAKSNHIDSGAASEARMSSTSSCRHRNQLHEHLGAQALPIDSDLTGSCGSWSRLMLTTSVLSKTGMRSLEDAMIAGSDRSTAPPHGPCRTGGRGRALTVPHTVPIGAALEC